MAECGGPPGAPLPHQDRAAAADSAAGSLATLMRFFRKRGADAATVDDLTQESYRRLYERMNRSDLSAVRNVEHYLIRIAGNIWREHLRRGVRPIDAGQVEFEDQDHGSNEFAPDRLMAERQANERVLSALNELPARARRVFIDFHLRGVPQKEIAQRLGITVSAIEKHVVKAKTHICMALREAE